jgi:hypothetical protein
MLSASGSLRRTIRWTLTLNCHFDTLPIPAHTPSSPSRKHLLSTNKLLRKFDVRVALDQHRGQKLHIK